MKNVKLSIIIALVCVLSAISVIALWGGKPVATQTPVFGRLPKDFKQISITTSQEQFDLVLTDGYWLIPQKNNYYANSLVLMHLFNSFKKATLTQAVEIDTTGLSETNLKIFGPNQNLLADVDILGSGKTQYVRTQNKVYLVADLFDLPQDIISWLEQPLVDISENEVKTVSTNGLQSSRADTFQPFVGKISWMSNQRLFKVINFMFFEDVMRQDNFDTTIYKDIKDIKITDFDGLITELRIYSNGGDYWVEKRLSPDKITRQGVNEFISKREFLYNGWVFKIPAFYGDDLALYATIDGKQKDE